MLEDAVRNAIARIFQGEGFYYNAERNLEDAFVDSDAFIEAVMERVGELYSDVIDTVITDIGSGDYDEAIEQEVF